MVDKLQHVWYDEYMTGAAPPPPPPPPVHPGLYPIWDGLFVCLGQHVPEGWQYRIREEDAWIAGRPSSATTLCMVRPRPVPLPMGYPIGTEQVITTARSIRQLEDGWDHLQYLSGQPEGEVWLDFTDALLYVHDDVPFRVRLRGKT